MSAETQAKTIEFKEGQSVIFISEKGKEVTGVVCTRRQGQEGQFPLEILADEDLRILTPAEMAIIYDGDEDAQRKAYFYALDGKNVQLLF